MDGSMMVNDGFVKSDWLWYGGFLKMGVPQARWMVWGCEIDLWHGPWRKHGQNSWFSSCGFICFDIWFDDGLHVDSINNHMGIFGL